MGQPNMMNLDGGGGILISRKMRGAKVKNSKVKMKP